MKIHAEINTAQARFIVVEAAGTNGGRKFGHFVNLRTVKLPAGMAYTHARQKGAEVIESWEVDARNQGPKSNYTQTLEAMVRELPDHAYAPAKAA
jgi:hypothetical protein